MNLGGGGWGSWSAGGRRGEARCFDDDRPDDEDDDIGGDPGEDGIGDDNIDDGCCDQHQNKLYVSLPRPPHRNRGSRAPGAEQGNRPDKENAPGSPSSSPSSSSSSSI